MFFKQGRAFYDGLHLHTTIDACFSDAGAFASKVQSETLTYAAVGKRVNVNMD